MNKEEMLKLLTDLRDESFHPVRMLSITYVYVFLNQIPEEEFDKYDPKRHEVGNMLAAQVEKDIPPETGPGPGTREHPFKRAPEDWAVSGLPYGAFCECHVCKLVARSTLTFDYYAGNAGELLTCEYCALKITQP